MGQVVSLDQMFGGQGAQPSSPQGGKVLSLDEMFQPPTTTQKPPAPPKLSPGVQLLREAATVADIPTNLVAGGLGLGADIGTRIKALASGQSWHSAGWSGHWASDQVQQYLGNPFERVLNALEPGASKSQGVAQKALGKFSSLVQKGIDKVVDASGGKISEADASTVANAVQTFGIPGAGRLFKGLMEGKKVPRVEGEAPVEEPQMPPAAQAVRDVKADIERTTGVSGEMTKAQRAARQAQVRAAFKEDPDYANYLRNYAEEEVRQRGLRTPMTAPGGAPGTGPRVLRTGDTGPLEEPQLPPAHPSAIETGALSTLDSALQKVRSGKSFALTPEERISLRDTTSKFNLPPIVDERGVPFRRGQSGAATQDLINKIAKSAGLVTLGEILSGRTDTLKSLERLPQAKGFFGKEELEGVLRQQDIPKGDKEILGPIVAEMPAGGKISAQELMGRAEQGMGKFGLTKQITPQYAEYGLEGIGRMGEESAYLQDWEPEGEIPVGEATELQPSVPAETHVWQLPYRVSEANHFNDPNYFGHTRTFTEDGIRHVVEIQSDLAQKAGKVLSEEERSKLEERAFEAENDTFLAHSDYLANPNIEALKAWQRSMVLRDELRSKLRASNIAESSASPMFKNWDRRLVREELADAARSGESQVRFATADTVAKVEGWPKTEGKLRPEHQGIYDRYKKDVEKFLKSLGGKEITDAKGESWIEVPVTKGFGRSAQFGKADPRLLAKMAAVGIGALAGGYFAGDDDRVGGMLLGALGGAAATRITPRGVVDTFRKIAAPDTRVRITDLGDNWEYSIKAAGRATWQIQNRILDLVPDESRRIAITHWIEGDKSIALSPKELEAAKLASQMFEGLKTSAMSAGVLKSARENYVTHLWEFGKQDKSAIERALMQKGGMGMSPRSPFAQERTINTLAEGKAMGLTPQTEDIAQILGIYGNSMARSIANAQMIRALKEAKTPEGMNLIIPADKAPHTYVSINHPQLQGLRIHPDIESSMRFLFDARDPGVAMRAIETLNTSLKRLAVSFSLFHAKALTDAMVGGSSKTLEIPGKLRGFAAGTDEFLKQLRTGGTGDLVDRAMKSGLEFSLERHPAAVEDVGGGFYAGMEDLQKFLDNTVPGLGKPVEVFAKANHKVDNFMWARLHAGMKLNIFAEKVEELTKNNAEAYQKNPAKYKLMSEDEIGKIAASYTNDLFGGLNWRRVAEGVKTRWGRDLALGLLSPSGRRGLQLLMFAPDWTISTTRAAIKAFGKGTGVKGLLKPQTLADLHRQYLARSAVYYLVVGDALNMAFSGHHLWDNKDPTAIDLGDGRKMQWSKHTMEPIHWMTRPGQQALGKLGTLPREAAEQALGVEYLSASGHMPPMQESRAAHALKSAAPISLGQQGSLFERLASFGGVPVYGQTQAEKAEAQYKRRMKKLEEESQ